MANYAENLMKHKKKKHFEVTEVEWVHKPTSKRIILKTAVGEIDVDAPELIKDATPRHRAMWRIADKLEKFDRIKVLYSKDKVPQIIGLKKVNALTAPYKEIEISYSKIRRRFPMVLKYVDEIAAKRAVVSSIWSKLQDKKKALKEIKRLVEKLVIKSKSL